ncbi:hypothetical protein BaRGS_00031811 [Batillaria attramentaria]|uniref:Uncharacterized protein n=1 Tax=Batillaria attramentaria TaxID=370345 RepID=A0ABD0JQ26_9CAEN
MNGSVVLRVDWRHIQVCNFAEIAPKGDSSGKAHNQCLPVGPRASKVKFLVTPPPHHNCKPVSVRPKSGSRVRSRDPAWSRRSSALRALIPLRLITPNQWNT